MNSQPNILLFITDQQRADHLGCTNPHGPRTPAIDSLAARGTLFERFYVASPVCMPNRASLMTCRPPSLHGVRHNGLSLPLASVTFVVLVRAAGWRTALIGKSHLQNFTGRPARPVAAAHGRPPPPELAEAMRPADRTTYEQENANSWRNDPEHDVQTPYYGFDDVEICTGHADRVHGTYGRWLAERHPDPASLRGPENALPNNRHCAPQAWRTSVPEELYPTSFVKERTIQWLERYGRDGPFMLQCSFPDPHHPFTPPGRYWDMYDPRDMRLPTSFNAGHRDPPRHVAELWRAQAEGRRNDRAQSAFAVSEDEARSALALTFGMVSMIDDAVAEVLGTLARLDLSNDTIIIFTSDHGDLMGDHRLLLKGPYGYDGVVRVPMIWAEPGAVAQRTDALGSTMDIGATILARLGLAPARGMLGQSLLPAMQGGAARQEVLIEYESQSPLPGREGAGGRMRTLITSDARLTVYDGEELGELYALDADPGETTNLWNEANAADRRAMFTERLSRAMIAHGERSPAPRYEA